MQIQQDRSVFSEPYFQDEPTAKKFNKRGLLAMANSGPNKNGSNFFITLTDRHLSHLDKKHTIFG